MEYNNKYLSFWTGRGFELSYSVCGYFDNRPQIAIRMLGLNFIIKLPFRNKWTDECDSPRYGVSYHNNSLWVYTGGKGNDDGGSTWVVIHMPWDMTWYRTSMLRDDGSWEDEFKWDHKNFYLDKWDGVLRSYRHHYTYKLKSGVVQEVTATVRVSEMEWRPRGAMFTKLFRKVRRYIDVKFDKEVGEESGSWKGGCIGCSYDLLEDETPSECLRRMERNRKF